MPRYYGNQNAGVGLSLFSPTFRANTPFVDLSVVQNTYNTLEQGHHQAVAQAAAYKEALAQMDLNEAEDGWRQQLIDEIDSALTNNTQYGNSYAALDAIVKLMETLNVMQDLLVVFVLNNNIKLILMN